MIAVPLALALLVDAPSPSSTALPKPTPPYLTAPKGWTRLKNSPRSGPFASLCPSKA